MSAPGAIVIGAFNPIEGKVVSVPTHPEIEEKIGIDTDGAGEGGPGGENKEVPPRYSDGDGSDGVIIVTGADASAHLLLLRDDHEPALTFRSLFLATVLCGFQAVVYQIYQVSRRTRGCCITDQSRLMSRSSSSSNPL